MGSDHTTEPMMKDAVNTQAVMIKENEAMAPDKSGNVLAVVPGLVTDGSGLHKANNEQAGLLIEIAEKTAREVQMDGQAQFRSGVRKMADLYAEKTNTVYSEKQLKKLDKIALKLEKKQQQKGPDVQWGPSNNLEWAILGAAAVGLFVGIFGIGFGWFIFLIAALAYLYFKLLHNN
jgi:hypothetical protein